MTSKDELSRIRKTLDSWSDAAVLIACIAAAIIIVAIL